MSLHRIGNLLINPAVNEIQLQRKIAILEIHGGLPVVFAANGVENYRRLLPEAFQKIFQLFILNHPQTGILQIFREPVVVLLRLGGQEHFRLSARPSDNGSQIIRSIQQLDTAAGSLKILGDIPEITSLNRFSRRNRLFRNPV